MLLSNMVQEMIQNILTFKTGLSKKMFNNSYEADNDTVLAYAYF